MRTPVPNLECLSSPLIVNGVVKVDYPGSHANAGVNSAVVVGCPVLWSYWAGHHLTTTPLPRLQLDSGQSQVPPRSPLLSSSFGGFGPSEIASRALPKFAPLIVPLVLPFSSTATPSAGLFAKESV